MCLEPVEGLLGDGESEFSRFLHVLFYGPGSCSLILDKDCVDENTQRHPTKVLPQVSAEELGYTV